MLPLKRCNTHGSARLLLVAAAMLAAACCCRPAAAHGAMVWPASRNFLAYLREDFYNSHGLNAGGNKVMGGYGQSTWPDAKLESLCGDAPGETRWDAPGEVEATYTAGQTLDVDAVIAVNHMGRVELKLCDLDAKPGDTKCTQLHRADGKGAYWYLPFVVPWSGGNSGFDAPSYGDGSFSWYRMPELHAQQGCRKQMFCNQYWGQVVYRTQWRLPADFTCQHCKLQWSYMTASSCWAPCPAANAAEPTCSNVQVYPECGKPGTTYPEYFLNCADVSVVAAGGSGSNSSKPAWEPRVALQRGPFGTPAAYKMMSSEPVPGTQRPPATPASAPAAAAAASPAARGAHSHVVPGAAAASTAAAAAGGASKRHGTVSTASSTAASRAVSVARRAGAPWRKGGVAAAAHSHHAAAATASTARPAAARRHSRLQRQHQHPHAQQ